MSIAIHTQRPGPPHSPAPTQLDERRVLGDLSPNAKVVSRTPTAADFRNPKLLLEEGDQTPRLPPVGLFNNPRPNSRSSPVRTGQKRTIEQVDGPLGSPTQDTRWARTRAENEITSVQATAALATSRSPSTQSMSDGYSEPGEEEDRRPKLASQDSSTTHASFSSLIDYNPQGVSSQQEQGIERIEHENTEISSTKTRAELLRLRLRVAMYKVQTNQVNVPLSRLQLHTSPGATHPNTPTQASPVTAKSLSKVPAESTIRKETPSSVLSNESELARSVTPKPSRRSLILGSPFDVDNAAKAIDVGETDGSGYGSMTTSGSSIIPKLVPGPVLKPTAYSSRFITAPSDPRAEPTSHYDSNHSRSSSGDSFGSKTEIASMSNSFGQVTPSQELSAQSRGNETTKETEESSSTFGNDVEMTDNEDTAANGLLELMHAGASASAS